MTDSPALTLICPDLLPALEHLQRHDERPPSLPGLDHWVAFGKRHAGAAPGISNETTFEPWQWQLLCALGLGAQKQRYASAPVSWMGGGGGARSGTCLHADPVHLTAAADHLQLSARVLLEIDDVRQLQDLLNAQLRTDEMEFAATSDGRLYLWSTRLLEVNTFAPGSALHSRLDAYMPQQSDGAELRRIMTEVQMLLHEHSINKARERRGLPTANSLWLWGTSLPQLLSAPSKAPLPRLWGNDPYVRGLSLLHQSEWRPLPADGSVLDDACAQGDVAVVSAATLEELEERWINPLLDAIDRKRISPPDLFVGDTRIRAPRSRRWPRLRSFGRRSGTLQDFLH